VNSKIIFRVHAVQRMFKRGISYQRIRQVFERGETIEDYSAEMAEPSRLILGFQSKQPIHIVASENSQANEITIITVYIPDPNKWNKGFKSRKS
jgi:uncharacterized DUF497 family protein